jgi:hypothetical protein
MKKIFIAFFGLCIFALNANAQKKSGAIQFETTTDPAAMASANGIQLSEEMKARMPKAVKTNFELLFTANNASYMPVEESEDSNGGGGGGMGRMMMRFGGAGGNREYYYSFADKKLVEVFDLSDTTYVMESKLQAGNPNANMNFGMGQRQNNNNNPQTTSAVQFLPVPPTYEVVKSDETKKIFDLNCNKVTVKTIRKAKVLDMEKDITEETVLWYTKDLGFDFSPNPNLWTEGAVLAIENKGNSIVAKSIEYRNVSNKDVTAPKKAIAITQDEYRAKMEAMMKKMRGNFRGQGGASGQARSIVIN